MTAKIVYEGNLRTRMTHVHSGTEVLSDAPLDNHGKAEAFSPTDMVATSLGSCMITTMGIKLKDRNIDLTGTVISITKIMASNPRRISEIQVRFKFPPNNFSDEDKAYLENTALTCPVAQSLHPDIKQIVNFDW